MKKLVQFDKKSHTEMSVARADKYLQRYGTCLADGLEFILKGALVDFSFNPFTYQQMLSIHQTTQRNISTDHYIQRRLQAFQTANRHCAQIIPGGLPANGRLVHLLSKSACVHSMHPGVRLEVVQTLKLLCKTKKVQALLMKDASLRESLVEHLEKCIMITLKLDSRHQSVAFDIVECASSDFVPEEEEHSSDAPLLPATAEQVYHRMYHGPVPEHGDSCAVCLSRLLVREDCLLRRAFKVSQGDHASPLVNSQQLYSLRVLQHFVP
eukprot:CAMPEP_0117451354 /NCGR_PEP_ID=MMETSP0759-20121206/8962_1 /TAXON_ID=63605 /ORGANISM="Percolomonas cosmopolitus, Strain WS" /LENGTH=266 /DNA_ID=CAMNT_0005243947 /DNA_START=860 /DNA_END=1659 /DNA_ORIENTATION=+